MSKIIGILKKIFARCFKLEHRYVSKTKNAKGWVYISYIPEVFYNLWNERYMSGHQSRQEMVRIVSVFNKMGYNVYVSHYINCTLPDIDVNIVFGIEPGFVYASQKYSNAKKIYYATGAYYGHQNKSIKERTAGFNLKNHTNYPCQRLVDTYNQLDYADKILQIGSKFTIESYPEKYKGVITTIHQSGTVKIRRDYNLKCAPENEYMWIGGSGAILKGLDIVFDYFIEHTEKVIHIIGVIDEDFFQIYKRRLTSNILIHGYMNLNTLGFVSIASRCNFLIYPSCTEGGCPGAVINGMAYGLIPIVSKWAAFDEIEDMGYLIEELSVGSLSKVMEETFMLSEQEICIMKTECCEYSRKTYNIERFSEEFSNYIKFEMYDSTI